MCELRKEFESVPKIKWSMENIIFSEIDGVYVVNNASFNLKDTLARVRFINGAWWMFQELKNA